MRKIRLLSLLLATLLLLSLFAACKKDPEPEPEPDSSTENTEPETVELRLASKGKSSYTLVCDYKAGSKVLEACNAIHDAIRDVIGAEVAVKQCYSDRELPEDVVGKFEILVGNTNRTESIEAIAPLRSKDYVVGAYGTKVVIASPSESGTIEAAGEFITQFVYAQGNRAEVKAGRLFDLVFNSANNKRKDSTYSYSVFDMVGARIDSFALIYPKADPTGSYRQLAETLKNYISSETGYELGVYKDSRCYADYEILVGPTSRSDEAIIASLADDQYYIGLTEKKNAEGEVIGGTLQILFGSSASQTVYQVFRREVMPFHTVTEEDQAPLETRLGSGKKWTNAS